jgi:hypothetical protein
MGKHAKEEVMKTRARVSAWSVFISMAGTTMSFQVYHSLEHGYMPWPLAYLYGIVPLLISMLLIEVISGWNDAPKWIRWVTYLIIAGAMFLSASATGAVVFRAAPHRASLLFGLLLDGAAILAARFLMADAKPAAVRGMPAGESGNAGGELAVTPPVTPEPVQPVTPSVTPPVTAPATRPSAPVTQPRVTPEPAADAGEGVRRRTDEEWLEEIRKLYAEQGDALSVRKLMPQLKLIGGGKGIAIDRASEMLRTVKADARVSAGADDDAEAVG